MTEEETTEKSTQPAKSSGSGTCLTILITAIITFVVTAVLAGGGVYLWQKAVCAFQKEALTSDSDSDSDTSDDSSDSTYSYSDDDMPVATRDMDTDGTSPTDNTENFIACTLGTVPGAVISYDLAKTYMSATQKSLFTDDSYIPEFYGIQEGPDTYEMKTQTINGDIATVRVDVLYGEMMEAWAFVLIWEDGAWKIDEFRNDAQ